MLAERVLFPLILSKNIFLQRFWGKVFLKALREQFFLLSLWEQYDVDTTVPSNFTYMASPTIFMVAALDSQTVRVIEQASPAKNVTFTE